MKVGLRFVDPLNFVAQRFLIASIALLPVLVRKKRSLLMERRTWFKLIMLSLINAIGITSTNIGLLYETVGLSSLLTYTQPFFVLCLAITFLNERANVIRVAGVVSGFLGVAILYASKSAPQTFFLNSFFFLILGAFLWAVTVIYYKKFLSYVEPATVNIVQFPIGSAFLFLLVFMSGGLVFSYDIYYIFSISYTSVLGSALASTIWLLLIREEEATVVSASSLVVPVIATLLGWLFMGEAVGYNFLLSLILVLTGLYLVNIRHP